MRRIWFILVALIAVACCDRSQDNSSPPSNRPYYPSALLQNNNTLYVLSSNFDQRYAFGSLLSVNLELVDEAVANGKTVGEEAVTSSGFIPSLSDGAVFSPKHDKIVYVSRSEIALRSVPLSVANGQLLCNTTSGGLGQNCYASEMSAPLKQSNPYFLSLLSSADAEIESGVIGYLLPPTSYMADGDGAFAQPQYFELERFTWNSVSAKATIDQKIALGDLLRLKLEPLLTSQSVRTNIVLGSITRLGNLIYVLAETPQIGAARRSVYLLRVSSTDLANSSKAVPIDRFNITEVTNTESLGLMEIATVGDHLEIFISNTFPGFLSKFEMPLQDSVDEKGLLRMKLKTRTWLCDNAADMKLSPDRRKLVVACGDGKMVAYNTASLNAQAVDPASGAVFGRGPVKIHFDSRVNNPPFRFYAANFRDGSVSIFDLLESMETTQVVIARKGHIFEPSPPNQEGGTEK